jgi:hypothetical protein
MVELMCQQESSFKGEDEDDGLNLGRVRRRIRGRLHVMFALVSHHGAR